MREVIIVQHQHHTRHPQLHTYRALIEVRCSKLSTVAKTGDVTFWGQLGSLLSRSVAEPLALAGLGSSLQTWYRNASLEASRTANGTLQAP